MARSTTWTNPLNGLTQGFGTRDSQNNESATVETEGNVEILTIVLDWDSLPAAAGTAATAKDIAIPALSTVSRATLRVLEAFTSAGATTLGIGTKQLDGTVIDADGIDVAIAKTVIDADNDVVQCNGAQVAGVVTVGAADAYISTVVATGPYTAGKAMLEIEYTRPIPDYAAPAPIKSPTLVGGV